MVADSVGYLGPISFLLFLDKPRDACGSIALVC